MQTSVDLQSPFSYSLLLTLILAALVVLPLLIYGIYMLIKHKPKKRPKKVKKPKPVKPKPVNVELVRRDYLNKLSTLKAKHSSGAIDDRTAYIELSSTVRNFVHEVTGIDTQNFTLAELKELNMPKLAILIEKFYRPEFSYEDQTADINQAFTDARTVVSQWR